ncbi:4-hydroxythreonine-4-phosphate dehydrogenase PdxA [Brevundimonas sp. 2R-24]|uniref:4-hydroxythreonine-4-phosphate dehydrogenase n=1 Tax=Peiella sedimenti TaxID=3061083 RepID=A0ABT8SJ12_9CAUL|nr:4-hydroxythreonine-4-phosphate dehydrogenase PdxA [Caulobacteraceae bacterium XZ-24]
MKPARPLAVTLGDPAGIGPEIIAAAWRALGAQGPAFAAVGDADVLARHAPVRRIARLEEAHGADRLAVLHRPCAAPVQPGRPDPANAPAVIGWIETAVALALKGEASGVVTAPIAKSVLQAGGFAYPGHTEFLGALTADAPWEGERGPVMMLAAPGLRTVPLTIHTPLRSVPDELTAETVVRAARVVDQALRRDFGIVRPRLVLAGLNPHAGEGGSIGLEEADILAPAAERLRAEGIDIRGPAPADTLFHEQARQAYDAALCPYHDQALIPVKMLDFWGGVNLTLGLPIIRTSPDHGTAFDIAGKGLARPDSLIAAIRLAAEIAARR